MGGRYGPARKREYQRLYRASKGGSRLVSRPVIPDDVVVLEHHEPCFMCGVNASTSCRHRRVA